MSVFLCLFVRNMPDFVALLLSAPYLLCSLFLPLFLFRGDYFATCLTAWFAVEGGKGTASGELFNDIPDRIADPLIIIATGYAISGVPWGITLAWFAAILAVMTAYVRTLAISIGAPSNFAGPMAKQHRMAILTVACCVTAVESYLWYSSYALLIALIFISTGCIITLFRRTIAAYTFLENSNKW